MQYLVLGFIGLLLNLGGVFNLDYNDIGEFNLAFEGVSNAFMNNFIIIFVASIPIFSVYAIYRFIKGFIN